MQNKVWLSMDGKFHGTHGPYQKYFSVVELV